MKRSITDFFGTSPNKKAKMTEDSNSANNKHVLPVAAPSAAPQAAPNPTATMDVDSSSKDLTPQQLAQIETNRKKALALQLLHRITEPSWREVLAPGTKREKRLKLILGASLDIYFASSASVSLHFALN